MSGLQFEKLGPYRIERPLGRGGMGSVYLGIDDASGARAAVKVLSPSLAVDESFRTRFGAEIETLKKLQHPNIVQLLGFGEQDGHLFYVMEYVNGRTLQDELKEGRLFAWRDVARISVQCCQALKHAHDRGIIHRDLKPANLIYTANEQIKLLDFGIAKLYGMNQLTIAGGVLGTVDFMAPEQAEGRGVTARSDLYSIGSVMFCLLTRRPPFVGRNVPEVLHKLRYDEPLDVRTLAPDVPVEFELIIAQLLSKDPADRIATALALANRLKAMEYALSPETMVDQKAADASAGDGTDGEDDEDGYRLADADDDGFLEDDGGTIAMAHTRGVSPASEESLARHQKPTMSMSELVGGAAEPSETPSGETRFTTFDEAARKRATRPQDSSDTTPLWLRIAPVLGAVVIFAYGIWYVTRPPSADQLYDKIVAAGEDADPAALARVESTVDRFLELFPDDPRRSTIQSIKEEIDLYRLQKRSQRRTRLRGAGQSLTPVERAYADAERSAETDPVLAAQKLHALVDVFETTDADDSTANFVRLAQTQLGELHARAKQMAADDLAVLQRRLDEADRVAGEDLARADAIRHGIIVLYGQYAWARPAVDRARQSLAAGR